jgi:adenine-specific DNA-methyltransferase
MAKTYKGSLSLEWYNKQKSILLKRADNASNIGNDIPAPAMNWVNKDEALFYEIVDEDGRGLQPYWVDRNDIRVKETRPLIFQKGYKAVEFDRPGTITGTSTEYLIEELGKDDPVIENILIKGDNLLALNALKKYFDGKPETEKVKCAYLDVPYNTGSAFEFYDDNLGHSEWLTLIRDRFVLLKSIIRKDGFIFVQIDNKEVFRLKVLMDEIFGEENFINDIVWKRRGGSANPSNRLNNVTDYILWYCMSENSEFSQIYSLDDENTQQYVKERFTNTDENGRRFMKSPIQSPNLRENLKYDYKGYKIPKNGYSISLELMQKWDAEGKLYFPDDKTQNINRKIYLDEYKGQPISNLWTDIKVINPMSKERTEFDGGQKPEALIERILTFATNVDEIVLDVFGGSGTTFSAAHKMRRRWVGVEVGKHADTLIVPRMLNVLLGKDDSGITKNNNWQGGGSFKYYHLGPSIISIKEDGSGDFNWSLGKKFIEESLLLSYDYKLDETIELQADKLFQFKESQPTIGVQQIGSKTRVAIISLNEPKGELGIMLYEEIQSLYKTVKAKFAPEYINIFTNRGIEIAYDSKPDDLEIIKVPHAIFAELEK